MITHAPQQKSNFRPPARVTRGTHYLSLICQKNCCLKIESCTYVLCLGNKLFFTCKSTNASCIKKSLYSNNFSRTTFLTLCKKSLYVKHRWTSFTINRVGEKIMRKLSLTTRKIYLNLGWWYKSLYQCKTFTVSIMVHEFLNFSRSFTQYTNNLLLGYRHIC